MYQILSRKIVKKHIKNLKSAGFYRTYVKITEELKDNPFMKTHGFEILERRSPKPNLYAKKISRANRLVYSVDKNTLEVIIYSAWGHYTSGNQSLIHHKL